MDVHSLSTLLETLLCLHIRHVQCRAENLTDTAEECLIIPTLNVRIKRKCDLCDFDHGRRPVSEGSTLVDQRTES